MVKSTHASPSPATWAPHLADNACKCGNGRPAWWALAFLAAHHLYNSRCYCTVPCLVFEMEIKYDEIWQALRGALPISLLISSMLTAVKCSNVEVVRKRTSCNGVESVKARTDSTELSVFRGVNSLYLMMCSIMALFVTHPSWALEEKRS